MTPWLVASVVLKFCIYLGVAAGIGGSIVAALAIRRQGEWPGTLPPGYVGVIAACGTGVAVSLAYFFVRVGAFSASGFSGMFDPPIVEMLWQSPVGEALRLRVVGFLALAAVIIAYPIISVSPGFASTCFLAIAYIGGAVALTYSFGATGHTTDLETYGRVALSVHLGGAMWWAGGLYPLWCAARSLEPIAMQRYMHRFGRVAGALLAAMLAGGGLLLYLLLLAPEDKVSPAYAISMGLKLSFVIALLFIAARHKWRSVPRLLESGGVARFQRSLRIEVMLVMALLVLTAVFSTAFGPYAGS